MIKFKRFIGNKKVLSVALLSVLVLTALTGCTEYSNSGSSTGSVPEVAKSEEGTVLSVSTPTTLPITIAEDGEVLTADNATIINNSEGPILIEGVSIKGTNGWEVVAYGSFDSASTKVNTKQVAYQIVFGDEATGTVVNTTGEGTTNFPTPIRIEAGETLPLSYKADVPMQTEVYESLVVNEIAFIIALDNQ